MLHPLHHSGTIGTINGSKIQVYVGGIATGFILRMKTSAFAGLVFALPVILFQLFRFVTPGLEPRERKFAIPFVVSAVLLFVLGGYIAFLILPLGIHWLLGFVAPAAPLIRRTWFRRPAAAVLAVLALWIALFVCGRVSQSSELRSYNKKLCNAARPFFQDIQTGVNSMEQAIADFKNHTMNATALGVNS